MYLVGPSHGMGYGGVMCQKQKLTAENDSIICVWDWLCFDVAPSHSDTLVLSAFEVAAVFQIDRFFFFFSWLPSSISIVSQYCFVPPGVRRDFIFTISNKIEIGLAMICGCFDCRSFPVLIFILHIGTAVNRLPADRHSSTAAGRRRQHSNNSIYEYNLFYSACWLTISGCSIWMWQAMN